LLQKKQMQKKKRDSKKKLQEKQTKRNSYTPLQLITPAEPEVEKKKAKKPKNLRKRSVSNAKDKSRKRKSDSEGKHKEKITVTQSPGTGTPPLPPTPANTSADNTSPKLLNPVVTEKKKGNRPRAISSGKNTPQIEKTELSGEEEEPLPSKDDTSPPQKQKKKKPPKLDLTEVEEQVPSGQNGNKETVSARLPKPSNNVESSKEPKSARTDSPKIKGDKVKKATQNKATPPPQSKKNPSNVVSPRHSRRTILDYFEGEEAGAEVGETTEIQLYECSTTSSKSVADIKKEIVQVLNKLQLGYKELGPSSFRVNFPKQGVRFQIEVVNSITNFKNLRGVKFTRMSGDIWVYKDIYDRIVSKLKMN